MRLEPAGLYCLQDMTRQCVSRSAQLQVIYRLTPAETRLAEEAELIRTLLASQPHMML